jgi:hypothetical protein
MSDGGVYCPDAGGLFEHSEFLHWGNRFLCCRGNVAAFPFVFWIGVLELIPGLSMGATAHAVGTAIERATAPRAVGSFERAMVSAVEVKAQGNEGGGANEGTDARADDGGQRNGSGGGGGGGRTGGSISGGGSAGGVCGGAGLGGGRDGDVCRGQVRGGREHGAGNRTCVDSQRGSG